MKYYILKKDIVYSNVHQWIVLHRTRSFSKKWHILAAFLKLILHHPAQILAIVHKTEKLVSNKNKSKKAASYKMFNASSIRR